MSRKSKDTETDHIFPTSEGGPNKSYNKRKISRSENRKKGSKMPSVSNVSESSEPIRLASEIDIHTLEKPYKTKSNIGKRGFGGLKLK